MASRRNVSLHADRVEAEVRQLNDEIEGYLENSVYHHRRGTGGVAAPEESISSEDQHRFSRLPSYPSERPPAAPRYRSEPDHSTAFTTPHQPINPSRVHSTPFPYVFPTAASIPDSFDGTSDLDRWLVHFDMISEINKWEGSLKANYLCGALRGDALDAIRMLSAQDRCDYNTVVRKLRDELNTKQSEQAYRLKLRRRKRKDGESLLALSRDIRRLAVKAFPNAPNRVVEDIAVDHFVEALSDINLRLMIRRGKPSNITQAVSLAQFEEDLLKVDEDRNPLGRRVASIRPTNDADVGSTGSDSSRPNSRPNSPIRPTHRPNSSAGSPCRPKDGAASNDRDFLQWRNEMESKLNSLFNITKDLCDRCMISEAGVSEKKVRFRPNFDGDSGRYTDNRRGFGNNRSRPNRCFNCNEVGHYFRECPYPRNRNTTGSFRPNVAPSSRHYDRPPMSSASGSRLQYGPPMPPVPPMPPMSYMPPRFDAPRPTHAYSQGPPASSYSAPRPDRPISDSQFASHGGNAALNW